MKRVFTLVAIVLPILYLLTMVPLPQNIDVAMSHRQGTHYQEHQQEDYVETVCGKSNNTGMIIYSALPNTAFSIFLLYDIINAFLHVNINRRA